MAAGRAGDRAALDTLLVGARPLILGRCRRFLPNPLDAEEAAQDALLAIARRIGTFEGRSKFTTWMYQLTTNAAIDTYRKLKRRRSVLETPPDLASRWIDAERRRRGADRRARGRREARRATRRAGVPARSVRARVRRHRRAARRSPSAPSSRGSTTAGPSCARRLYRHARVGAGRARRTGGRGSTTSDGTAGRRRRRLRPSTFDGDR